MRRQEPEVTRVGDAPAKLSWPETAREMAAAAEDWSAWDAAGADGLDAVPWIPGRRRPRGR